MSIYTVWTEKIFFFEASKAILYFLGLYIVFLGFVWNRIDAHFSRNVAYGDNVASLDFKNGILDTLILDAFYDGESPNTAFGDIVQNWEMQMFLETKMLDVIYGEDGEGNPFLGVALILGRPKIDVYSWDTNIEKRCNFLTQSASCGNRQFIEPFSSCRPEVVDTFLEIKHTVFQKEQCGEMGCKCTHRMWDRNYERADDEEDVIQMGMEEVQFSSIMYRFYSWYV